MASAVIALAAAALTGCGGAQESAPKAQAPASAERRVVQLSPTAETKPVSGVVTTRKMGEARARIGGTLVRLNVKEGDEVRQGQVIGLIADDRIAIQTGGYEAQAAAARAELVRANADLGRVRTLYQKGFYAKAGLDQAEAAAQAAEANLKAAQAQRAASSETAAQGAVLAPSSGRVLKADVPAGTAVAPGQTIVTVTAGEPLIRVELPEAQARALKVGDAVEVSSEDAVLAGAARVTQVYPAVSAGRVVADVAAPGLRADLIGARVRVRIKVGERQAIILPRRFVSTRFGMDYVRLADKSGGALDVAVQLAPSMDPANVEILSGLNPGDVVLAAGAGR